MKKIIVLVTLLVSTALQLQAQSAVGERPQFGERPKLVVGIVVDQMRWDYLSRYYTKFGKDGFRRLIDQGYSFDNCLINYLPTVTAIGHTSAYTGTSPAFHGICGNNFCIDGRKVYCCEDTTVMPVGSSTYYMKELPDWAKDYNKQLAENEEFKKVGRDVGLYPLTGHITTDMAIAALDGEKLGKGDETDMLCVSYSETDVIGHKWGTRGEHTDEAYLELDKDLARLFAALDDKVGVGNYLVFLTADHGAAHNNQFMQDHQLHAGKWRSDELRQNLEKYVAQKLGNTKNVVIGIYDYRFFLDHEGIAAQGLKLDDVKAVVIEYLRKSPNVWFVVDFEKAAYEPIPPVIRDRILMGYNFHRSGDIIVCVEPGYYEFGQWSSPVGTTHGEWNPYDAHIPLLFYGWKVPHGACPSEVHITDIAPTVCSLLHIQQPNACVGASLEFK